MKLNKFLTNRLIDKLIEPLMQTFRLMFITMNYDLNVDDIFDLLNKDEFVNAFEICVRDSLKDYQNSDLSDDDLINNIKFNLGELDSYISIYVSTLCND